MTFCDFCEPSIEILPSFCLFRETPEIPDKIRRYAAERREEVTCPILHMGFVTKTVVSHFACFFFFFFFFVFVFVFSPLYCKPFGQQNKRKDSLP